MAAIATTDADNSGNANCTEIRNDRCRLHAQFDGGCSQHQSAPDNKPAVTAHVTLPTADIEMVGAIHFQHHPATVSKPPLGVHVPQPPIRVTALDLSIRLLNTKTPADSY